MKNLNTTLIWLIIGFVIGYAIISIFDSANIGVLIGAIGGAFVMYFVLKLQTRKNKCILPVVTTRLFCFDCWKRDGILDCKEIEATCEEHAILKFEKEFGEDYAYDPPY